MNADDKNNLMRLVASARMESYEFTKEQIEIAEKILAGKMTLEDYYKMIKSA